MKQKGYNCADVDTLGSWQYRDRWRGLKQWPKLHWELYAKEEE